MSPDNQKLAYSRGGYYDIYCFDISSRSEERLTFTSGNAKTPDWDPTGHWLVYSRPFLFQNQPDSVGGIHMVNVQSRADKVLRHDGQVIFGGSPQWSPDGRHITFWFGTTFELDHVLRQALHVYIIADDGSEYRDLTPFDTRRNWYPEWLGNGDILYHSEAEPNDGWESRVVNLGTSVTRIWGQPLRACGPERFSLSPDARFFVVALPDSSDRGWFLFTQDVDDVQGNTLRQITFPPADIMQ